MANGIDLSALSAYTKENGTELITETVLEGATIKRISVQTGVKTSEKLNYLSVAAAFQAGACGWNQTGGDTITIEERTVTVWAIKQNTAVCVDELNACATQNMMKAGSYNSEIPFENQLFVFFHYIFSLFVFGVLFFSNGKTVRFDFWWQKYVLTKGHHKEIFYDALGGGAQLLMTRPYYKCKFWGVFKKNHFDGL